MIMSCMNCTSAGEGGGSFARVDEGSVFVGLPGAPGWTTTGLFGSTCCEYTDRDNKKRSIDADSCKRFIAFVGGLTLSQTAEGSALPEAHVRHRYLVPDHQVFGS